MITRPQIYSILALGALSLAQLAVWAADEPDHDDQYRQILHEILLDEFDGAEVLVREHLYPPGWKAPTHYHDGDLFIYVVSGSFEVATEESGRVEYSAGQSVHMAANTIMDARNVSDSQPLKLVIFQVGPAGKPFLIPIE